MSDNGNHPGVVIAPRQKRIRGSGPILILAVLFVAATFLAWYFTWFGRDLTNAEITNYLVDEKHPRHVQHALSQIQQHIERGDPTARIWYPRLIELSDSPETEYRLTVAWLMGFDNQSTQFHEALQKLINDSEPIVRRNAALALVRFNDNSGRSELVAILKPYAVKSPSEGVLSSTLRRGSQVARGSLIGRIEQPNGVVVQIRSPLLGKIDEVLKSDGAQVGSGEEILTINSDEVSVWEALRGLSFVGEKSDLDVVKTYAGGSTLVSEKTRRQAQLTIGAIESRAAKQ